MSSRALSFILIVLFILLLLAIVYWQAFLVIAAVLIVVGIVLFFSIKNTTDRETEAVDLNKVDSMSGLDFEDYVAYLLKKTGYKDVFVTRASGDYGVDVLAKQSDKKYAIQCKCYGRNIGVKAVQEVFAGSKMYHADVVVVITNRYFTPNAITLAKELNVQLWDRDTLYQLISCSKATLNE